VNACEDWYEGIAKEIGKIKGRLNPLDQRRYKLPLLLRLAKRVASLSLDCEECQGLKSQITGLSENLAYSSRMTGKEYRSYLTSIKSINRHLKRKHKLVDERQYIKRFVSIGITFGLSLVILGYILLNFGITILVISVTLPALIIRVLFGYTIGYFLDKRAKRQGRVI
jgi:hypothetical protein